MKKVTTITWEKENGMVIKTNAEDATIKAAVELGWKQIPAKK